jgi:hypothetical protein
MEMYEWIIIPAWGRYSLALKTHFNGIPVPEVKGYTLSGETRKRLQLSNEWMEKYEIIDEQDDN